MAIQLPNPGLGDGQTGDNEFVMWTKVKDNFNNTTHAASRLVGTAKDQVPLAQDVINLARSFTFIEDLGQRKSSLNDVTKGGLYSAHGFYKTDIPYQGQGYTAQALEVVELNSSGTSVIQRSVMLESSFKNRTYQRVKHGSGSAPEWSDWAMFYTDKNTTTDSNKNIKTSSPVVRVFSDHLDKIHEANQLPIKYTRNGVGDYTIEGTTGLRENDWQIVIPEDDHRNQMVAFTIKDDNGTIHLKTYKRIFSMETFLFGPDLNTPVDIPEGRWVDLHFNDIPQEQTDEPIE